MSAGEVCETENQFVDAAAFGHPTDVLMPWNL
jgi:hypothetical protein